MNTVTPQDFKRVNNDVNGNPRYVCHYSHFVTQQDREETKKELDKQRARGNFAWFSVDLEYQLALKRAKKIGGRKFHNKQYGGGIVFQSYNIQSTCDAINELNK